MTLQQIQLRHGSSAEWAANNPVLLRGEPGIDTDLGKIKYGDGVTAWASLAYPPVDSGSLTGLFAPISQEWKPNADYVAGQLVVNSGTLYRVTVGHHAGSTFSAASLATIAPLTDADYLAAVKRVDGTGSGLDADTLDGVEAASLAPRVSSWQPNTPYVLDQLVHNAGILYRTTAHTSGATFSTANLSPVGMAAIDIRTALLTVDGVGSGIDADTLDGSDATAFARRASLWTASTAYKAEELVHNAGILYRVTTDHTSPGTFSTTNLSAISGGGGGGTVPDATDTVKGIARRATATEVTDAAPPSYSIAPIGQVVAHTIPTGPYVVNYASTGKTLIALIGMQAHSSSSVVSVTDTAGNTWTKIRSSATSGINDRVEMWWCLNAAPITSITITLTVLVHTSVNISEWPDITGLDTSAALLATNPTSTTVRSGAITPGVNNALVIATVNQAPQTVRSPVAGSPFTPLLDFYGSTVITASAAYLNVPTPVSVEAQYTAASTVSFSGIIASFSTVGPPTVVEGFVTPQALIKRTSSETRPGLSRFATGQEATDGNLADVAVSPATLATVMAGFAPTSSRGGLIWESHDTSINHTSSNVETAKITVPPAATPHFEGDEYVFIIDGALANTGTAANPFSCGVKVGSIFVAYWPPALMSIPNVANLTRDMQLVCKIKVGPTVKTPLIAASLSLNTGSVGTTLDNSADVGGYPVHVASGQMSGSPWTVNRAPQDASSAINMGVTRPQISFFVKWGTSDAAAIWRHHGSQLWLNAREIIS